MSDIKALTGSLEWRPRLHGLGATGVSTRSIWAICMVLICGTIACAGALQTRLERARALSEGTAFGQLRAGQMAVGLAQTLDRYAAIAEAFATASTSAETSAALFAAGGAPLRDIEVLDRHGRLRSELTGARKRLLPLPAATLAQARQHRTLIALADGRTLALLLPDAHGVLAVELDSNRLLAPALAADGILLSPSGQLAASGIARNKIPPADAQALAGTNSLSRIVDDAQGPRVISLVRVRGWPLVVATSIPAHYDPGLWSWSSPLYLFIVLGPPLTGVALAALFGSFFDRRSKRGDSANSLRATSTVEARLLVRLAKAERRASEAEGSKSRFVSHVSHELRTPLNAIIGFAEAIEADVFGSPGHPKYSEYAHDIGAAGRELHTKIGAVLEYAAVGKAAEPDPARNNLTSDAVAVAKSQIEIRMAAARAHGITIESSLPATAPARIDAGSLDRILALLLENAVAYTPKGGLVRVEVHTDARDVIVTVRDTGPGFTRAERELAGRPFQRFARPALPGGLGVGLAIAMGLTRRVGATLSLASIPGEGTRAELRVPLTG
jgi:signal transduction histidine kinase